MLDLGTGCGVLAIHAAKRGAQVVASDYDEVALQAARKNVKLHNAGEQVVVMQSDLLESISGKFSLIVANLPIVDSAWSGLAHSVKGQMKRLLEDLPEYLEPNGRCLVSFASFGNMPLFLELLKNQPLAYRESCQEKFGVSWSGFELRMR